MTKLETFMQRNGLDPAGVAREAGIPWRRFFRIMKGRSPKMRVMTALRIRDACRRLLLDDAINVTDLF
ncbi:MAG: hypothetical protein ACTHQM_25515 [Thermoanaerobaculia bacterium]